MQHTETYNLNLIETSDTFSPDPLNQNAQALEDALNDEADAREADVAALDARLKVFEAKHIKCGMYALNKSTPPLTINLGFTPKAVFAISGSGHYSGVLFSGYSTSTNPAASIVPGGFEIKRVTQDSSGMTNNTTYIYIALD